MASGKLAPPLPLREQDDPRENLLPPVPSTVAIAVLLFVISLPGLAASATAATELPDILIANWDRQRSEVLTAKIKCWLIRLPVPAEPAVTPADLEQMIAATHFTSTSGTLRRLAAQLKVDVPPNEPFGEVLFSMDGLKTRQKTMYAGVETTTLLFDGNVELQRLANRNQPRRAGNQITIFQPGEMRIKRMDIQAFRFVPPTFDANTIRILDVAGDSVVLQVDNMRLVADARSGLVSRADIGTAESKLRQIYQLYPSIHEDGIVFPSVRVKATFRRGHLTAVELIGLQSCEFNASMPRSEFWLASLPRDKVFDHRKHREAPEFTQVTKATDNILAEIDVRRQASELPPSTPPTGFYVLLTLLALAAAIYLGMRLAKKRSTS